MTTRIGVLALQGAFAAHAEVLSGLGVAVREVRTPADLASVDGLVLPGGESSTMSHLLRSTGMVDPLAEALADGLPALGTCAGLILLAETIVDGRDDQVSLGALGVTVRRNAYGRQRDSFETVLDLPSGEMLGVFIRAPRIEHVGDGTAVLARHGDDPVLVARGNVLGATFHPEISGSASLHGYFVSMVRERKA